MVCSNGKIYPIHNGGKEFYEFEAALDNYERNREVSMSPWIQNPSDDEFCDAERIISVNDNFSTMFTESEFGFSEMMKIQKFKLFQSYTIFSGLWT